MRKIFLYILLILSLLIYIPFSFVKATESPDLAPSAKAAILMDAESGRVLFGKRENERMLIASLTKIMTAIVAIENGKLDDIVTVGPNAVGVEGSSIYLKQGEKIPLSTLLYGLMLRSGNDAATAIAEHIGGSVEGFVLLMNQKSEALGLSNTHFANPSGLDAPEHYSSAKDLAVLTAYALKNPAFQEIVKTKKINVSWPGEEWKRTFINKNKLLRLYEWADGVKTGFTKKARRTLVGSATKNGRQFVTVTLNDGNDWNDHMRMFEFGFKSLQETMINNHMQMLTYGLDKYRLTTILSKGEKVPFLTKDRYFSLVAQETFKFPLKQEENDRVAIQNVITLPFEHMKTGKTIGVTRIYLNDQVIGSVPLTVRKLNPDFLSNFKEAFHFMVLQR